MSRRPAPPCFSDEDQFVFWKNMDHYTAEPLPSGYCTDCTPAYQAQMNREKRCKFPHTSFVVSSGEIIGVRGFQNGHRAEN